MVIQKYQPNETTMTVSTVELKDIISFDNKPDNFFDED
jgi:hypothetical protein